MSKRFYHSKYSDNVINFGKSLTSAASATDLWPARKGIARLFLAWPKQVPVKGAYYWLKEPHLRDTPRPGEKVTLTWGDNLVPGEGKLRLNVDESRCVVRCVTYTTKKFEDLFGTDFVDCGGITKDELGASLLHMAEQYPKDKPEGWALEQELIHITELELILLAEQGSAQKWALANKAELSRSPYPVEFRELRVRPGKQSARQRKSDQFSNALLMSEAKRREIAALKEEVELLERMAKAKALLEGSKKGESNNEQPV